MSWTGARLILGALWLCTGSAAAEEICLGGIAPGVDWCAYGDGNLQSEIHWAIVDLTQPEVALRVTREEDAPLTTSQEAANLGSTVTINGDWESASYSGPHGLSVGDGWHFSGSQDWDGANPAGDWSFLACTAAKQCRMNPVNLKEAWTWDEINVIGGNGQRLVIDGVLQTPSYDSCTRPRSGVCLDATGDVMMFFVAEGDNACGSDTGWTPSDFAQFVYAHGCHDGLMLDGGGSSDLVLNQIHVTDRPPSEPDERSTHNHLSVIHHQGGPDAPCATLLNGRRCEGDTLVTCQGGAADAGDCDFFGAYCEEGGGTAYCVNPVQCPNGADGDVCVDAQWMTRCKLGQPWDVNCADIFGASCENTPGGARCVMVGCDYGGDASWCDGDLLKTCTPDTSGDLEVSFLTTVDCAAEGASCVDTSCVVVDVDGDGVPGEANGGTDCDDGDASVYPGAMETCDGADDDCDGATDEGVTNDCGACGDPPTEVCNGLDDDCDGATDEGLMNPCGACGDPPVEICNGLDDDCDGITDEGCDIADAGSDTDEDVETDSDDDVALQDLGPEPEDTAASHDADAHLGQDAVAPPTDAETDGETTAPEGDVAEDVTAPADTTTTAPEETAAAPDTGDRFRPPAVPENTPGPHASGCGGAGPGAPATEAWLMALVGLTCLWRTRRRPHGALVTLPQATR